MKRLIAIALVCAGCYKTSYSDIQYEDGYVLEREYHAAYTTTWVMPVSCGKNCTTYIPMTDSHPERWTISFHCQHGQFTVESDRTLFDKLSNGQQVRIEYLDIFHEYKSRTNHAGFKFITAEALANL